MRPRAADTELEPAGKPATSRMTQIAAVPAVEGNSKQFTPRRQGAKKREGDVLAFLCRSIGRKL
ncbi:hypothetical protein SBA2_60016 [Acidobacteriia bacterium SbA2]|nr:hypothetical protein SBA2_60016 [Acidobacteriia bacterium SbA2]